MDGSFFIIFKIQFDCKLLKCKMRPRWSGLFELFRRRSYPVSPDRRGKRVATARKGAHLVNQNQTLKVRQQVTPFFVSLNYLPFLLNGPQCNTWLAPTRG